MIQRALGYFYGDSYQARAVRGTALTVVSFGGQNFLRLASNLILTRLLFPEAFGLMVLVQVVLSAAAMFSDVGLRDSIIRDERGSETSFQNTVWTLQIARGFLLTGAILVLAQPLARFYEEEILADLLVLSAFVPAVHGFESTKIHLANRELILGRLTALSLGSQVVGIATMVLLAIWLNSVWALAIGGIVGAATAVVLSHLIMPGAPNRLYFERDAARLDRAHKHIYILYI